MEDSSKKLGTMFEKLEPAIAKVDKVMSNADDALKSIKAGADSFSVATKKLNSGDGLFSALMSDRELKADFKSAIADLKDVASNVKRSGFVFYRNVADKEREKQEQPPDSESSTKKLSPLRRPGR